MIRDPPAYRFKALQLYRSNNSTALERSSMRVRMIVIVIMIVMVVRMSGHAGLHLVCDLACELAECHGCW